MKKMLVIIPLVVFITSSLLCQEEIQKNDNSIVSALINVANWFIDFDKLIDKINDKEVLKKALRICNDIDSICWEMYLNKQKIFDALQNDQDKPPVDEFYKLLGQLDILKLNLTELAELMNKSKVVGITEYIQGMQYIYGKNDRFTKNEIRYDVFNAFGKKDMSDDMNSSIENTKKIREMLAKIMDKIKVKLA